MNLLVTICARGGSKGIPDKNIKELNGTPVIAYTIKIAQNFAKLNLADIALSTDSPAIKEVAAKYNLLTKYQRPSLLASDKAGKIDAIRDVKEFYESELDKKYDYVLDLDVSSPFRTLRDLEEAFEIIQSKPEATNIFSVNPSSRNPYFNMVEMNENGYIRIVKNIGELKSRQEAPKVFDINGSFYFYNENFFKDGYRIAITPYTLIYEMNHICFDLDHPQDFMIMEILLKEKLFVLDT